MPERLSPVETAKRAAARRAADLVEPDMALGIGTGSTAYWLIRHLGERIASEGLRITGVPTSSQTAELASKAGIALVDLEAAGRLDLTIDGADEFDSALNLVKGGGGALLREKIVAAASDRMIVIADKSKHVETLGAFPLPVEVTSFGWQSTKAAIEDLLPGHDLLGDQITLRLDGEAPFVTDGGNLILDLHLKRIGDPRRLARDLNLIPGVVESGLFIGLCDTVVIGHGDGRTEIIGSANGIAPPGDADFPEPDNLFADLGD
ncbi:ribose-5-phosphate isomerase [Palleronia aestuarii]|uniref:Ribose-5-phosphate isomerase A n=1 Tax=Palleronia aestuarii TaxID=568105 RepID=A0A2W7P8J7_9RHOB|nr:ribose-5-phosphate isomerase RpiA [Palleronia aestuarii]PZX19712.1 ribose-5-phosphate isomerase [Palleronia aestuarii]